MFYTILNYHEYFDKNSWRHMHSGLGSKALQQSCLLSLLEGDPITISNEKRKFQYSLELFWVFR